jgi:hypothetical protein
MSLPFDATVKGLAEVSPRGMVGTFDRPPTVPVTLLNVDLSTITTAADVVFGLGDPLQEIVHLDFQAGPSADKHRDILVYNALLHRLYKVPVHSIVVLLRKEAQHSNLNGKVRYMPRPRRGKMDFGFDVVALWKRSVESLLADDISTIPLAPLGKLPKGMSVQEGLAGVVQQVVERLHRDAPPEQIGKLLTAAFVLTGLRVPRDVAIQLFQGVRAMHDSDTYQFILDEGEVRGLRRTLLRLGRLRFGEPDQATQTAVAAISDLERLGRLSERLLYARSWQELLQTP